MGFLQDKELQQYRDLVQPPGHFDEGFTLKTFLGTLFVGLVMVPAAMYMDLMMGGNAISGAAKWVTVILFLEMAKRARTFLKPAELLILMAMVGAIAGSGGMAEGFFWRQYIVQSDAARSFGMENAFPSWYCPSDPEVLARRSFFQIEWLVPLLLVFVGQVISRVDSLILGYGLFRLVSDIEKLPFPMAPMSAVGVLALSENSLQKEGWRWRCFTIGSGIGMLFALVAVAVPTISGAFLTEPFLIFPIPFLDTTRDTQDLLPAVATGLAFDLGAFVTGMAVPFFGVLGSAIGLVIIAIMNPILVQAGVLKTWRPGMGTVETLFANNLDFYLSFGLGLSFAVAIIGLYQVFRSWKVKGQESQARFDRAAEVVPMQVPKGVKRGDIPLVAVLCSYVVTSSTYILLSGWLLNWDFRGSNLLWILLFFAVVYVPFISYVTARLEGLAGMAVSIPFIKEAAFIFSGFKGIEVWLLPIPMTSNYGIDCVQYRTNELIGCSFRSIWKMQVVLVPLVFVIGLLYGQFIWSMAPIPSIAYPYTQEMWDFNARNTCLAWSATSSGFSPFLNALRPSIILIGMGVGLGTFMFLSFFGLPILLLYGVINGWNQPMPHGLIVMLAGALFGRFVMRPVFGESRWRQYALVVSAGFGCGVGLIMMFSTGVKFLASSVFKLIY